LSGVVEIDEFAAAALIGHYDNTPLWVRVGTNKDNLTLNDLECPIQFKVRFTDARLT